MPGVREPRGGIIELANVRLIEKPANTATPTKVKPYAVSGQDGWVTTVDGPLTAFAADIETDSFTIARRKLRQGKMPPAPSVRVEEWVNHFDYHYPAPTDGAFGVSLEAAPSPFQTSARYQLFRVGIQAETPVAARRPPVHLSFVANVSGTWPLDNRLELAKRALIYLVQRLQPEDTVALTTCAQPVLHPTKVASSGAIAAAILQLNASCATATNDGLQTAYSFAEATWVPGHENRVIVLSDARISQSTLDDMLVTTANGTKRGISMSAIDFGMSGNYAAALQQLAHSGNGNYYHVDSMAAAQRVFGQQFDSTLYTIARDVELQVEFDAATVKRYRLIGYENRALADPDFRSVHAGEVGPGHSVTALYELEIANPNAERIATVRIRHRTPDKAGPTLETTAVLRGADVASTLADTSTSFRFASSVAAFAEIARESPFAQHLDLDWVEDVASAAIGSHADRADFLELLRKAKALRED